MYLSKMSSETVVILLVQMNHSPFDMGRTDFAEFMLRISCVLSRGIIDTYLIIIAGI